MKVLLKHPSVHLHMLWQWKWGAEAQKPTGVLAIGLPTLMHRHCLDEVTKPTTGAIGRTSAGEFRTAKLKEYPAAFSKGLAYAMGTQLMYQHRARATTTRSVPDELKQWLKEAALESQRTGAACFLPDYQGR